MKEDGNEQMGDSDWVQKMVGTGGEIQTRSRRRERAGEQEQMGYSHWEKVLNSDWKQKSGRNRREFQTWNSRWKGTVGIFILGTGDGKEQMKDSVLVQKTEETDERFRLGTEDRKEQMGGSTGNKKREGTYWCFKVGKEECK